MRRLKLLAFLLITILPGHPDALAKEGSRFQEGETVLITPDVLHPTQFNAGLDEVNIRRKNITNLMKTPSKLVEYLKENKASAVVGPEGALYLIDGHHISRAVLDSGLEEVHVEIVKDYSDLSQREFWEKLRGKKWVYLYDHGRLRSASELPKNVRELTDDPFRTLAWMIRKVGGYEKVKVPFAEFIWANFLRERMVQIDLSTRDSARRAIDEALKLAASEEAGELPGAVKNGPNHLNARHLFECRSKYEALQSLLFH